MSKINKESFASQTFTFGEYKTSVFISREIPSIETVTGEVNPCKNTLIIADENTFQIAKEICGNLNIPICQLKSGEENKNWQAVETILCAAHSNGIGRDGLFIGVGGGVIGDLAGFAASVYMRGCSFILVSTTLLGMVDASVGGKTGFDIFDIKNLAGSFYPALKVFIPIDCLATLPKKEWKSGFAELIKTAILGGNGFFDKLADITFAGFSNTSCLLQDDVFLKCIQKAVLLKGKIVTKDPKEAGKRALLNLGHTFGHALEAAAGLGRITHGEAVAWGIVQACGLGLELGITPRKRAEKIINLLTAMGYDCSCPHPFAKTPKFFNALKSDKKIKHGKLTFIIPDRKSARIVPLDSEQNPVLEKILKEGFTL